MTEPKWTPGEWLKAGSTVYALNPAGTANRFRAHVEGGFIETFDKRTPSEEAFANASLIAAAPDMYEALEEMSHFFYGEHSYDHPSCIQIRAALARARGET